MSDDGAHWVSISAAARALGISRPAIRGRIKRGTLETREAVAGNRRVVQVRLPEGLREHAPEPLQERTGAELAVLRERVARLEELLAEVRGDRDRLAAELARRRWPGVLGAIRRLLVGGQ